MDIPQILKTTDYSIFKNVNFNRDRKKSHILRIKKTIQKENLLHLHPILVNENMEVIDGQHRLEAAKELALEIYYIKSQVSYNHILNSNLTQKNLSLEDIIKFYAVKDKLQDYIMFREYIELLEISPKSIFGLFYGTFSPSIIEFIKSGKFSLPTNKSLMDKLISCYMNFRNFAKDKKIKPLFMITSCYFTVAFRNLVMLTEFNEAIFLNKLSQRWFDLKPQLNSKEWTKLLISIYNWKNQNPINFIED